jgi:hypothetical protein
VRNKIAYHMDAKITIPTKNGRNFTHIIHLEEEGRSMDDITNELIERMNKEMGCFGVTAQKRNKPVKKLNFKNISHGS